MGFEMNGFGTLCFNDKDRSRDLRGHGGYANFIQMNQGKTLERSIQSSSAVHATEWVCRHSHIRDE